MLIKLRVLFTFFGLFLLFDGLLSLYAFVILRIILEGLLTIIIIIFICLWLLLERHLYLLFDGVVKVGKPWLIIKHVSMMVLFIQSKIFRHVVHFLLKILS